MTASEAKLPALLAGLFSRSRETPSELALTFPAVLEGHPEIELTWSQLAASASHAAKALAAAGTRPGDVVLILTPQTHEQIIAFLGAMAMGGLPTILSYPSIKQSEGVFLKTFLPIVEKTKARVVVSAERFLPLIAPLKLTPVACPKIETMLAEFPFAETRGPLFLQFSSGTTGLRKGVAVTEEMFESQMKQLASALSLSPRDRVVGWLPLYHDMGLLGGFLMPLFHGLASVHIAPFAWLQKPASLFEAVSRYQGTLVYLPNFAYGFLADRVDVEPLLRAGVTLKTLRALINCSETIRHSAHENFLSKFSALDLAPHALQASYAMAENTFAVTLTQLERSARLDSILRKNFMENHDCIPLYDSYDDLVTFVSCGKPIHDTQVRIAGTTGERKVGEIEIKGGSLFSGYWNTENGSSGEGPFTSDGWYRTGDLGYLAEGELFVTGRSRDLIISRGVNIYPNDIEETVFAVEGVKPGRAVAFGCFDERTGTEQVVVMCELEENAESEAVCTRAREAVLAAHAIRIEDIKTVEAGTLRKSTSGKLSRSANRDFYQQMIREAPRVVEGIGNTADLQSYYKLSPKAELWSARWWVPFATGPWSTRLGPLGEWLKNHAPFYVALNDEGATTAAIQISFPDQFVLRMFNEPMIPSEFIQLKARSEEEASKLRQLLGFAIKLGILERVQAPAGGFDSRRGFVVVRRPASDQVVFFFKGGRTDVVDVVPAVEFASATGFIHHNLVMLRDVVHKGYTQGISLDLPDRDALLGWLRGFAEGMGGRHVHCAGNSLGAYGAMIYGHCLRAEQVWAFSPFELKGLPRIASVLGEGNGVTQHHIWYGDKNDRDREVAESLRKVQGVHLHPVPHDSHLIVQVLWERGELPMLLTAPPVRPNDARPRLKPRNEPTLDAICEMVSALAPGTVGRLARETPLEGILDSFASFQLLSELEKACGIL